MTTAVYQVTRPGHEHCDATEGILLDITPLVVDRRKFVTLYDKDLTEGVNLLIGMTDPIKYLPQLLFNNRNPFRFSFQFAVVSDLWGPQCVRLKVTVKSDNCGENAECSNKGICFSNASMVSTNRRIINLSKRIEYNSFDEWFHKYFKFINIIEQKN